MISRTRIAGLSLAGTLILVATMAFLFTAWQKSGADSEMFRYLVIDSDGPSDPWGKSVGDLNGDGLPDLLIGGHGSQQLVWYSNPDWKRATIFEGENFSTDHEIADIDDDGLDDVISLTDKQLVWYRNPDWTSTTIANESLHDIEVADFDNDGDMDIIARNQSAFGGSGAIVHLFRQDAPDRWTESKLTGPNGEGLKVIDINNDGYMDILVNTVWFENPGGGTKDVWKEHTYSRSWTWPHVFIDARDIDGDGRIDIALSPAEPQGGRYRISWFQAPVNPADIWTEHVIAPDVESVIHFVGLEDMDGDGDSDLVSAHMHQGNDPDDVTVYLNGGKGAHWLPQIVAVTGSHSMRLADIDQDGDIDMFGANWSGEHQTIELWQNRTCPQSHSWRRQVLDDERPWTAVFVAAADLDQDGFQDVVAGAWWYRNPGLVWRAWERRAIGQGVGQFATVADFDGDGLPDILATKGKDGVYGGDLVWVRNLGEGRFADPVPVAQTGGDFLQGVAVGDFSGNGATQVALSWHGAGMGVQLLTAPPDSGSPWLLETISSTSQDEALSAADLNRDGNLDLLLGTKWLENTGGSWLLHNLSNTSDSPDRNRLADINGDGRLDAVVGFEAINVAGDLVWYEQPERPEEIWRGTRIASITGPMSLDVADWDKDGDLDIVAGEHNLERPEEAEISLFINLDGTGLQWEKRLIHRGDEHHDGALFVDLDNDGDLDVVSIGWGHNKVIAYENRHNSCVSMR